MKVYIITNEPFPHGMAASKRIYCYAKGMQAAGLECEVITVYRTEKKANPLGNVKARGIYDGVCYRYIANTTYRNVNVIIRKINDALDLLRLFWFCRTKISKKNIIWHYSESVSLQVGTLFASCFSGVRHIRELCEYPFVTQKNTLMIHLKKWIMLHFAFPFFDAFIVISQALHEVAESYKGKKAKILKVPILVDIELEMNMNTFQSDIPYIFHAGYLVRNQRRYRKHTKGFCNGYSTFIYPFIFLYCK